MTPRVFVVQQPMKMTATGWQPIFDLSTAAAFGSLKFILLKPGNIFVDRLAVVIDHMRSVLHDFGEEDFLLPTGEPLAIALAAIFASKANGGRMKLLKWDNRAQRYHTVQIGA